MIGTVATGRAGLEAFPQPSYEKVHGKDKCQLVLKEVRARVEEQQTSKMVGKQQQEALMKWGGGDRKVS